MHKHALHINQNPKTNAKNKTKTNQTKHNQIAPSPSSSSTQEHRLDNISPTPELAAEAEEDAGATTSGISKMETSSQSISGNIVCDATDVESSTTIRPTTPAQLNSPNANTTTTTTTSETTTTVTREATTSKLQDKSATEATPAIIETTTITANSTTKDDVDLNNTTTTSATTTKSADASPKADNIKAEHLNGNDKTNGNANIITTSKTTTTTSTTTSATNGNTTTNTAASAKTSSTTDQDEEESNKTKLGKDHLFNDINLNSNNISKVVEPSKNPFGDEDDDDEQIYEVPKGE